MKNILNKASEYVIQTLENQLSEKVVYHNLSHTLEVVESVELMGKRSGLGPEEMEELLLAAWFHDIGYMKDYYQHELRSAEHCSRILTKWNYPSDKTNNIAKLILATQLPHNPSNLHEGIVCDADICYIGKKEFYSRSQILRKEWELVLNQKYTEREWITTNITFLLENQFHTEAAKHFFDVQRMENVNELRQILKSTHPKEKIL